MFVFHENIEPELIQYLHVPNDDSWARTTPMTNTAKKAAVRMTENRKRLLQSTVYIGKKLLNYRKK